MKISAKAIATIGLSLSLLLSGCANQSSETASGELGSVDEMFLEMMIPHHDQALEMSHLAEKNTSKG